MRSTFSSTDEQCWSLLREGDKDSLLQLYSRHYHTLFFIGLKNVPDSALVKDVIQQQFLYFWEKRASLSVAKNVRSYIIISFLRRLSKDWVKSHKKMELEVAWSLREDGFFERSAEEQLIEREYDTETREKLLRIIQTLPARQRELIFLRFYEGLSYDEIVNRTGLARRTVYNKIHEALDRMREEFPRASGLPGYGETGVLLVFLYFLSQ